MQQKSTDAFTIRERIGRVTRAVVQASWRVTLEQQHDLLEYNTLCLVF
jgi:hypothetical protein